MKKSFKDLMIVELVLFLLVVLLAGCSILPDKTDNKQEPLPMPSPVINLFKATPDSINPGQAVTLSWNVSGAGTVTIQPVLNKADLIGTMQVSPMATTAYTLIATNESGSVTSYVAITVSSETNANNRTVIGVDPVTGRNPDIGFRWEQLCLSDQYQVQIAKDAAFTLMVFDSGVYAPPATTSPAMLYGADGRLEAGHSYYWRARVRQAATGQTILGPWSLPESFIVSSGYSVNAPAQGIRLLSPPSGCSGYLVAQVPFSWSPYQGTTRYRFILARDAGLTDIVKSVEVPTSSYLYDGRLEYSTSYFWQVTATQPAPGDPSPIFSFTTQAKSLPEPTKTEPVTLDIPLWVWVASTTGIVLIMVVLALIITATRNKI
jgi:hypothetical protein